MKVFFQLFGQRKDIEQMFDEEEPKKIKHGDVIHYWCMPGQSPVKYLTGIVSDIDEDTIVINGYGWYRSLNYLSDACVH